MPLDPAAIGNYSPYVLFVCTVLGIVVAFVRGDIVSGRTHDRVLNSLDSLASAVEKQATVNDASLRALERRGA